MHTILYAALILLLAPKSSSTQTSLLLPNAVLSPSMSSTPVPQSALWDHSRVCQAVEDWALMLSALFVIKARKVTKGCHLSLV